MYSKIKLLSFFVLMLFFAVSEAHRVKLKKNGGTKDGAGEGEVGYKTITVSEGLFVTHITCENGGPNKCPASTTAPPAGGGIDPRLEFIPQIEAMMVANGITNGVGDIPTPLGNLHFEYQGFSVDPLGINNYDNLELFEFN